MSAAERKLLDALAKPVPVPEIVEAVKAYRSELLTEAEHVAVKRLAWQLQAAARLTDAGSRQRMRDIGKRIMEILG